MDVGEFLSHHGIKAIRSSGSFKTTCPKCSHTRRNKTDRCLSVTIDHEGCVVHCHHCGWAAGSKGREPEPKKSTSRNDGRLRTAKRGW